MIKTSTLSKNQYSKSSKKTPFAAPSTGITSLGPPDTVVNYLLNYSRSLSVKKSIYIGFVENLLN